MGNHQHFFRCYGALIVFGIMTAMTPLPGLAGPGEPAGGALMSGEAIMQSGRSCEECHAETTPLIFRQHMEGEHGRIGVSCADCHGNDHRAMPAATARAACEQCHPNETATFLAGGHSRTWENMAASVLYRNEPEVIRRTGCEACHRVGSGDDDGRCDCCHRWHGFSRNEAADPRTCSLCHPGPDHPQQSYQHSAAHFIPATCAGCHLPGDSHNAGENLDQLRAEFSQSQCAPCHDAPFISQWLQSSAITEEQGRKYLAAGRQIISLLRDKGRLSPDPRSAMPPPETDREPAPATHLFYGDISRAEKLAIDLQRYLREHAVRGAYHQDFRLAAHAVLLAGQQRLGELQAESRLLQELAAEKVQLSPLQGPVSSPDRGDIFRLSYESSRHGVLANGPGKPSCETCHGAGEYAKPEAKAWAPVCGACHPAARVDRFVEDLVLIREHADQLRRSADETVAKLITKKVLGEDNAGKLTLLDDYKQNQQVAEVLLARLVYYLDDLDRSRKYMGVGVAHANPAYTLWYASGQARGDLIEIRDAAVKLLRMKKVFVDVPGLPFGPLPQEN
ncbi:MAG: multiheme c-type cytochrome [Thermodesulfobacteriota bacterium]